MKIIKITAVIPRLVHPISKTFCRRKTPVFEYSCTRVITLASIRIPTITITGSICDHLPANETECVKKKKHLTDSSIEPAKCLHLDNHVEQVLYSYSIIIISCSTMMITVTFSISCKNLIL